MGGNLPAAFFVSQDIAEREVTLADGSVHKLRFREPSARTMRRYYSAAQTPSSDELDTAVAEMIAAALVDADGQQVLTVEQALTLKFEVQAAMVVAIRGGTRPGKPSSAAPKTGSGSSSRRTSEAAASSNGKRRSRRPSSGSGSSSTS
jgi:hypothetical protein